MSIFKKLFKKKEIKAQQAENLLPIKNIIRETDKAVSFVFDKPASGFEFQPGQYLTLQKQIDGQAVRRAYSLSSQPTDTEMRVTIKEIPDGFFSKYANKQAQIGEELIVLPPAGNFTFKTLQTSKRHIVAFAGGSGITPIYSIANNLLLNEPESKFSLIYGNRTESDIIFKHQLDALQNSNKERLSITHILSDQKNTLSEFSGYIDSKMVSTLSNQYHFAQADLFYLCGPGEMVQSIEESLLRLGIDKSKIKKELFTAPINSEHSAKNHDEAVTPAKLTYIYNGKKHQFTYTDESKTMLDIALDNGIKAPFSCLNGVCSTCSAKVESGSVKMNQNFALEKEDIEQGYILTCQSRPTAKNVVVNWDDNKM